MKCIIVIEEWTKREIVQDRESLLCKFPSILTLIAGKRKGRSIVEVFLRDNDKKADILDYLKEICKVSFDVEFYPPDVSEGRPREMESLEKVEHNKKLNPLSEVEQYKMGNMRKLVQIHEDILLANYSNLVGIGVSRIVDGSRCGKPCIVLHCLDKTIVPFGENMLPKFIEGYPVEVQENLYTFAFCETCPPIDYHCSIGTLHDVTDKTDTPVGSVGFFVKHRSDSPEGGFLTAAHIVFCEKELKHMYNSKDIICKADGKDNYNILHQSKADKKKVEVIGQVHKAFFGNCNTTPNGVDRLVGIDAAYVKFASSIQKGMFLINRQILDKKRFDLGKKCI